MFKAQCPAGALLSKQFPSNTGDQMQFVFMLSYNYSSKKKVYFETPSTLKLGCQHPWHAIGRTRWVESHLPELQNSENPHLKWERIRLSCMGEKEASQKYKRLVDRCFREIICTPEEYSHYKESCWQVRCLNREQFCTWHIKY